MLISQHWLRCRQAVGAAQQEETAAAAKVQMSSKALLQIAKGNLLHL